MGFSAHVVQRPYLSFTTFNFDHDYDYNYNYNYDYDHDYDHDHYTTRATYLTVQIFDLIIDSTSISPLPSYRLLLLSLLSPSAVPPPAFSLVNSPPFPPPPR